MWWERPELPLPKARRLLRRKTSTNQRATVSRRPSTRRMSEANLTDQPERVAAPCQAGREALRNCRRAVPESRNWLIARQFRAFGPQTTIREWSRSAARDASARLTTAQTRSLQSAGSLSVSPARGTGCAAIDWSNPLTSASGVAILYAIEPAYLGCDALPGASRLNNNIARPAPQCGFIRDVVTHLPERSDWPR